MKLKSRFLRAVCSYYHMFFFVIRDLPPVYRRKSESEDLEEITWIGEEWEWPTRIAFGSVNIHR